MALSGNDVYVAGFNPTFGTVYWKNGQPVTLLYSGAPGYRLAYGIAIKPH